MRLRRRRAVRHRGEAQPHRPARRSAPPRTVQERLPYGALPAAVRRRPPRVPGWHRTAAGGRRAQVPTAGRAPRPARLNAIATRRLGYGAKPQLPVQSAAPEIAGRFRCHAGAKRAGNEYGATALAHNRSWIPGRAGRQDGPAIGDQAVAEQRHLAAQQLFAASICIGRSRGRKLVIWGPSDRGTVRGSDLA